MIITKRFKKRRQVIEIKKILLDIFLVFLGFVLGLAYQIYQYNLLDNSSIYSADLINFSNNSSNINLAFIKQAIKTKQNQKIKAIGLLKGGREFVRDVLSNNITDLKIEKGRNGFLLSFTGFKQGNSIHNFFGFFAEKYNSVQTIYWHQNSQGEVIEKNEQFIKIKNTSNIPWNINNQWEDFTSAKILSLESENEQELIQKNEIGIFHFLENEDEIINIEQESWLDFTPHNITHGFLIEAINN